MTNKVPYQVFSLDLKKVTYRGADASDLYFELEGEGREKKVKLTYKGFSVISDSRQGCLDKLADTLRRHAGYIESVELVDTPLEFP